MKILEDYLMHITSPEKALLYTKWLRPVTSDEFRKGFELINGIIKEDHIELWLLDAGNGKTPARPDQEWAVAAIGSLLEGEDVLLRKVALIKSRDMFFSVIADWLKERVREEYRVSAAINYFYTLPEAYDWLLKTEGTAMDNPQSGRGTAHRP